MRNEDIICAWKDDAFRASLAPDQQTHLPDHPAGIVELSDTELLDAAGGTTPLCMLSVSMASAWVTQEIMSYYGLC